MDMSKVDPAVAGFDPGKLRAAVQFALDHESEMDRDIGAALEAGHFDEPPDIGKTIGPVKDRAGPSGMILRHGRLVAEWGDIDRVDMTFSISKSYLALCAGIAVDDGLIADIDAPVRELVRDGSFGSPQNRAITWRQLLNLTSEWQGTLWDKPDWIDHNRDVGAKPGVTQKGIKRQMQQPGTYWEYNDVRVNVLALALLHVFKRPLPVVLKERIMDPIGASDTWHWHGYENSWVEIDGRRMQSVSGGAHWGGGLWISTRDHARVGALILNDGKWNGTHLLSADWLAACRGPCALNTQYGMLWWLNANRAMIPQAPALSYLALGVGTQIIWIDHTHDMVVVARWLQKDKLAAFGAAVMNAISK